MRGREPQAQLESLYFSWHWATYFLSQCSDILRQTGHGHVQCHILYFSHKNERLIHSHLVILTAHMLILDTHTLLSHWLLSIHLQLYQLLVGFEGQTHPQTLATVICHHYAIGFITHTMQPTCHAETQELYSHCAAAAWGLRMLLHFSDLYLRSRHSCSTSHWIWVSFHFSQETLLHRE